MKPILKVTFIREWNCWFCQVSVLILPDNRTEPVECAVERRSRFWFVAWVKAVWHANQISCLVTPGAAK